MTEALIQTAGNETAISDETDIRWAVNVLLEQIAAKFDAWETMDLWRSEAAATVRSFKHDLGAYGVDDTPEPRTAAGSLD